MAKRTRKYLVYMFGSWETIEKSENIITNIRDVMRTIVVEDEFTFVTGTNVIIMCIKSRMDFTEIEDVMSEFLTPHVNTYFLMPKPRKLGFRMDKNLENHLFGYPPNRTKLNIDPRVAKELTTQLKNLMDSKVKRFKDVLLNPTSPNPDHHKLRPLNVDKVLDKIIEEGIESLTPEELDFLNKYNNI